MFPRLDVHEDEFELGLEVLGNEELRPGQREEVAFEIARQHAAAGLDFAKCYLFEIVADCRRVV